MRSNKFQKQMEELEVNRPLFYHDLNDTITVCLLTKDGAPVSRGVAICSTIELFVRKVGRAKALGRAIQALSKKGIAISDNKIRPERFKSNGPSDNFKLMYPSNYTVRMDYVVQMIAPLKATYMPKLTGLEKRLLGERKWREEERKMREEGKL